jgi:shikimate 5-dehydrogenase
MIKSRKFKAVIDLPYNHADTPLAEYCRKKERKYVSGRDFWQLQAKEQEEFFMNSNKVTEV